MSIHKVGGGATMHIITILSPANAFIIECLNAVAVFPINLDWGGKDRCEEESEGEEGVEGLHRNCR